MNKKMVNKQGQSLIEMLIAVAVIAVVVTALTVLGISSVRSSQQAKKKSAAAKLANKGVELVRMCRDKSESWQDFLNDCNSPTGWSTSIPSGYTGDITVVEVDQDGNPAAGTGRALVAVTVSFTDSADTHETTAKTYLTNWQ